MPLKLKAHKPFAEAWSSERGRQVISDGHPGVPLPLCRVSSTSWQSGQKTGRGRGSGPCAAEEGRICIILLEAREEVNLDLLPSDLSL